MSSNFIPIYQPYLAQNTKKYVNDCLDTNWISSKGEYIKKFEDAFCSYTKINHATTVFNGTVALHLALLALEIKPGDEIIVPTFTYVASVNCIKMLGAVPVFIDCLADTFMLDPAQIEAEITPLTKAIIVPHLYGFSCEMDEILRIAKKHNLFVVEDCAESFGTFYKGKHSGIFGDIATFSFFGNKTITTGEGGMVAANNELLIKKCAHLKAQGLQSLNPSHQGQAREYFHDALGYNYRMTNIQAAIGLAQMEDLSIILQEKQRLAKAYINGLDKRVKILQSTQDVTCSYWMIAVLFETKDILQKVREKLTERGVETRPFFPPVHTMPMYRNGHQFKISEDISTRGLNLPSFPMLSGEKIEYICKIINESLW